MLPLTLNRLRGRVWLGLLSAIKHLWLRVVLSMLEFRISSCPARTERAVLERACLCVSEESIGSGNRMKQLHASVVSLNLRLSSLSICLFRLCSFSRLFKCCIDPCCPVRSKAERLQVRLSFDYMFFKLFCHVINHSGLTVCVNIL